MVEWSFLCCQFSGSGSAHGPDSSGSAHLTWRTFGDALLWVHRLESPFFMVDFPAVQLSVHQLMTVIAYEFRFWWLALELSSLVSGLQQCVMHYILAAEWVCLCVYGLFVKCWNFLDKVTYQRSQLDYSWNGEPFFFFLILLAFKLKTLRDYVVWREDSLCHFKFRVGGIKVCHSIHVLLKLVNKVIYSLVNISIYIKH